MKPLITTLVSTGKGWFIRQAMKYAAALGGTVSTWLLAKATEFSLDPVQAADIAAKSETWVIGTIGFVLSIAAFFVEGWLSKKAAPIAAK